MSVPDFRFDQGGFGLGGPSAVIELDTSRADRQLTDLEKRTLRTARSQVAAINRVTNLTILSLQAFGIAIGGQFRIMMDFVSTAIQTFINVQALYAVGNPTGALFTAVLGAGELALMIALMTQIEQQDRESQIQIQALISITRQGGAIYG